MMSCNYGYDSRDFKADPLTPQANISFNQVFAETRVVASPTQAVRDDGSTPARMKLLLHASEAVRFEVDAHEVHPRLKAATRAADPEFAAVMLPLPGDVSAPHVQFQGQVEALLFRNFRYAQPLDLTECQGLAIDASVPSGQHTGTESLVSFVAKPGVVHEVLSGLSGFRILNGVSREVFYRGTSTFTVA
jgi:hypothetical protein